MPPVNPYERQGSIHNAGLVLSLNNIGAERSKTIVPNSVSPKRSRSIRFSADPVTGTTTVSPPKTRLSFGDTESLALLGFPLSVVVSLLSLAGAVLCFDSCDAAYY